MVGLTKFYFRNKTNKYFGSFQNAILVLFSTISIFHIIEIIDYISYFLSISLFFNCY
uniref:NADH-plastoquinone oxidoreductase subunit K n=1 Tax=Epipactis mairei TaxID=1518434 RepID=A0A2P1EP55_9ASPA|nr:NADH-plastoquinone oxidoreductase subunit K [Epipactis mairei]